MPIVLTKKQKAPREAEDMAVHPPFRTEQMMKPYQLRPNDGTKFHGVSRIPSLDSAKRGGHSRLPPLILLRPQSDLQEAIRRHFIPRRIHFRQSWLRRATSRLLAGSFFPALARHLECSSTRVHSLQIPFSWT